jgi:septum formation protein
MTREFILASASPRRRDLLKQAGYLFSVMPSGVDETVFLAESPTDYVRRVADAKLESVIVPDNSVVLACDTTVALGQLIIGKPESLEDAIELLSLLSGRTHLVLSAVSIGDGIRVERVLVESKVTFREIPPEEIRQYVATGEPMDVAGGYAIQRGGAAFVKHVEGSYTNVVGLPMEEVKLVLAEFNVYPVGLG